jgi:hypothetical protein
VDAANELRKIVSAERLPITVAALNVEDDGSVSDAVDRVLVENAAVGLVIHAGFANLLRKGQEAPLQVLVDGTNSNTALIALGYINTIAAQFSQDYVADLAKAPREYRACSRSRSRSTSGPGSIRISTVNASSCLA